MEKGKDEMKVNRVEERERERGRNDRGKEGGG